MKVLIAYTVEVSEWERLLIAAYYADNSRPGRIATRDEVRKFFETYGDDSGRGLLSEVAIGVDLARKELLRELGL